MAACLSDLDFDGKTTMLIALISKDLMAASQIVPAAESAGADFRQVSTVKDAIDACVGQRRSVIIADLGAGIDIAELVQTAADVDGEVGPSVIAYAPHVHTEKLQQAKEAGCDAVLSRGQVQRELAGVLQQLLSTDG